MSSAEAPSAAVRTITPPCFGAISLTIAFSRLRSSSSSRRETPRPVAVRDVDDEAAGQRDLGREPRALRLHRILDRLDEDRLAALDQILDLAGALAAFELGADDLVDVEEAVLLEADLDERGLHPRQDVVDGAEVDVAGDRALLGPLEVDLGDDAVLEHGDALLAGSTEISSSRLAFGSGARRGAVRRGGARAALAPLALGRASLGGRSGCRVGGSAAARRSPSARGRRRAAPAPAPRARRRRLLAPAPAAAAAAALLRRWWLPVGAPATSPARRRVRRRTQVRQCWSGGRCAAPAPAAAFWRRNQGSGKEDLLRWVRAASPLSGARVADGCEKRWHGLPRAVAGFSRSASGSFDRGRRAARGGRGSRAAAAGGAPRPTARSRRSALRAGRASPRRTRTRRRPPRSAAARAPRGSGVSAIRSTSIRVAWAKPRTWIGRTGVRGSKRVARRLADRPRAAVGDRALERAAGDRHDSQQPRGRAGAKPKPAPTTPTQLGARASRSARRRWRARSAARAAAGSASAPAGRRRGRRRGGDQAVLRAAHDDQLARRPRRAAPAGARRAARRRRRARGRARAAISSTGRPSPRRSDDEVGVEHVGQRSRRR